MKKINLLFILFICLFIINVKADMGPPSIELHKVMVTNKEGTYCYENGKKTDKLIPYGTMLDVMNDIHDSYIYVTSDEYNCDVKYADVSAKTQSFDLNKDGVEKIAPVKAVILASGGLNLRKGPSVTYSKIITVPQYTVVTLSYRSGTYWFYTEYNGNKGWITGMNSYFGTDSDEVLYNYKETKIYNYSGKSILGKIPANTEIKNYLKLSDREDNRYYVNYNGIKGYIRENMFYKVDEVGKIKLIKDYEITDETGKPIKKLTANQELEYNMVNEYEIYIPSKNITIPRDPEYYEDVKKANISVKKDGFIGEGLYGEDKGKYEIPEETISAPTTSNEPETKKVESKTNTDTIIICLLGGILLALTALVIVKIVNSKNNKVVVSRPINNRKIEETIDRETSKEEMNDEKKE